MNKYIRRIRYGMYQYSWLVVIVIAIVVLIGVLQVAGTSFVVENSFAFSTAGLGVAAFLFTVQGILITMPENNRFLKVLSNESNYLHYLYAFCRRAELLFMLDFIPVLLGNKLNNELIPLVPQSVLLKINDNIPLSIVFLVYLCAFIFSVWSMWLLGAILLRCERYK